MEHERGNHADALDQIIEKYTATPKNDPELVDYVRRPVKQKSRRQPIRSRRGTNAGGFRRARRAG